MLLPYISSPKIKVPVCGLYIKRRLVGYLKNIYDFPFDIDNHQDFFNLPFHAFACFAIFLVHHLSFM